MLYCPKLNTNPYLSNHTKYSNMVSAFVFMTWFTAICIESHNHTHSH